VIALAGDADDWKVTTLKVGLTWLVGVSGIVLGSGHLFMATSIGGPTSRFQWEVGLANVGYRGGGRHGAELRPGVLARHHRGVLGLHARRRGGPHPVDADDTAVQELVAMTVQTCGGLDCAVNNLSGPSHRPRGPVSGGRQLGV
jgi:hypothetical protein